MQYKNVLISGGAGFVGSSLGIFLREAFEGINITCIDNLKRRGSELNISRLNNNGISFCHGDIRNNEDFAELPGCDLFIDCAAEPSALAGMVDSPRYILNTNLLGTINCLEYARNKGADFVFLSTSRVYSIEQIKKIQLYQKETRFVYDEKNDMKGVSSKGISESFSLKGSRTLYGTSKLSSELIISEYINTQNIRSIINRCSVLTGPWQMGKVDQGFMSLWMARHIYGGGLKYLGYGGHGKQVRDVLHIYDLFRLILMQINEMDKHSGVIYNVGGGIDNSLSLKELTMMCEDITGKKIKIACDPKERIGDIPWFISDCSKVENLIHWKPEITVRQILCDLRDWMIENKSKLLQFI